MSHFGIPDPGAPSGTFAALERATPIVLTNGDVPTTTSMRIANGTQNEHASVLRLIRDNAADFEEFGRVGFEIQPFDTAGGPQRREVAILNEEHATLLLTYLRNNDVVRDFKKRLVHEFYAMRRAAGPQTREERFALAITEAGQMLAEKDEKIAELSTAVVELTPAASAWTELADAAGDYSVADAAKVLSRDPSIATGERRLFQSMQGFEWVYRRDGRWKAYQAQVDCGRLVEKAGKPYVRNGEMCVGDPTIRVTPKGVAALHSRLGGSGEQLALVVSS